MLIMLVHTLLVLPMLRNMIALLDRTKILESLFMNYEVDLED